MQIIDPMRLRRFAGVKFIYGNPATGQRVKLDPKDFNEMQDIWLQHIDDFVKAMRGNENGILRGCEVILQPAQLSNALSGYELVVTPGEVYVNSALIKIATPNALPIPLPSPEDQSWSGFKTFYLMLKPELREFVPTNLGDPGMSSLAGQKTTHRIEIGAELVLQDSKPSNDLLNDPPFTQGLMAADTLGELLNKHSSPWFVLLAEVKIRNPLLNYQEDIIVSQDGVYRLKLMREIQDIAEQALRHMVEHLSYYYTHKPLVGNVDGLNRAFTLPMPVIRGTGTTNNVRDHNGILKIYANFEAVGESQFTYTTNEKTFDGDTLADYDMIALGALHNTTEVVFNVPPEPGTILTASYYPEHHPQYLSYFSFLRHIDANSADHDNRYYTEAEVDAWRSAHNQDEAAHPKHLLKTDFQAWENTHLDPVTNAHGNTYSLLLHKHSIEDTFGLTGQINLIGQQIGYNNEAYHIVTYPILDAANGINTSFPVYSSLLNDGSGWIKQVRADISNDAVVNPAVLKVIDIAQEFSEQQGTAFSQAKAISNEHVNNIPALVVQSDDEIWAIWGVKESENEHKIWFASRKPGDGYFSPPTSTDLSCDPIDGYPYSWLPEDRYPGTKISATVIYSAIPAMNQRIGMVWEYNGQLHYAHIDKGQTAWTRRYEPIPGTERCHSPAIAWINDGTASGKLHLLYSRMVASTGKMAIFRRRFEIDFTEYGTEELVSSDNVHSYSPCIAQDKSPLKRVWYAWVQGPDTATVDIDNAHNLIVKVVDKFANTVYYEHEALNTQLNMRSEIAMTAFLNKMQIQYSRVVNGSFQVFVAGFDFNLIATNAPLNLAMGQNHGSIRTSNNALWLAYSYLGHIYYRGEQIGISEVKWDNSNKLLVFSRPPVPNSQIYVDIAVPLRSLNARLATLETQEARSDAALAVQIRAAISAMGLELPQQRFDALRNKMIVEAEMAAKTRQLVLGYAHIFFNKFFHSADVLQQQPLGIITPALKGTDTYTGFATTSFINSGLEYDSSGKISNRTGHTIIIYSDAFVLPDSINYGTLRLEANGGRYVQNNGIEQLLHNDLSCLEFRITNNMTNDPTGIEQPISWFPVDRESLFCDLNWSTQAAFVSNKRFGVEITIRPGGCIYDFALFLNKRV